jgi:hypothetical protein
MEADFFPKRWCLRTSPRGVGTPETSVDVFVLACPCVVILIVLHANAIESLVCVSGVCQHGEHQTPGSL